MDSNASNASADYSAARLDRRMVAVPALVVLGVGIVTTGVSAAVVGGPGALGAALGCAVVIAFFGIGQLVLARTLRANPAIAVNMALFVYVIQIAALFALLVVFKQTEWLQPKAFAAAVFAGVIAWTIVSVTLMLRAKVLTVEPGSGPPSRTG